MRACVPFLPVSCIQPSPPIMCPIVRQGPHRQPSDLSLTLGMENEDASPSTPSTPPILPALPITVTSLQSIMLACTSEVKTQTLPTCSATTALPTSTVIAVAADVAAFTSPASQITTASSSSTSQDSYTSVTVPVPLTSVISSGQQIVPAPCATATIAEPKAKCAKTKAQKDARPLKLNWERVEDGIIYCNMLYSGDLVEFHFSLADDRPEDVAHSMVCV